MISRRADSRILLSLPLLLLWLQGLPIFAISVGLNTCDKASQVQYYVQSHIQINECHDRVILVREPLKSLFNCLCPVCGKDQESTEHTCVTCAFAQTVWHLVSQWCKLRPIYAFRQKPSSRC
ncbi:uncharacterized protein LOC118484981 isoform X2 [Helianthus annuus]|uniref:uncharacterized protein LOC118484981 isoform X2 n=1 Tax=Helianthus annuus TaxID=4232 RepID=UPI001652C367|nr:uncharacterized protein LOC118484981 isoform X2 [Helianthus annuus]